MDAKGLLEYLKADLTCSICLCYFTDPVTVKCGHNFCTECLLKCREGADATLICPECRQIIQISNLVPNKNLQNLCITGKMIRYHLLQSVVGLATCDQHGEKEKLFCEEDKRLLCESCLIVPEHKDHQVLPLDKAADKYKEKLQESWNILQKKQEQFKISLDSMRRRETQCKADAFALKQSITSEYEKMHQFLLDEECLYLERVDQESKDKLRRLEEKKTKVTQQIQDMQQMMLKIEENLNKDPLEMLQDMKDTLARNEELLLQEPEIVFPAWSTCPITGLRKMLRNYQREITLDPETANPHLILSEDLRSFNYTSVPQDLPDNAERFDCALTVLGAQTFTSGKHYWEVEVGDKTEWSVGICEDSVSRKGTHSLSSKDVRTLAAFKSGNDFFLWNSQCGLRKSKPIHKVGIFLDYEKGHIGFYNVTDKSLIYSPPNAAFQGPLRPYFSPFYPNDENIPPSLIIYPWSN
ncbi:putative E3 ubiquitin-protein ligase TRIML1 [Phascolarctos cinereus]|uniref:Probable E3 ubiquitin-protein ligase TRIML1 n=1 Tax=Phascolarctos cinereus TaxID=38626 RepID=A0A6P5L9W0_PHACI|nr:probable E3 ubiquitin-protein ligase TRIML1 [Phascolarctos cinereus]